MRQTSIIVSNSEIKNSLRFDTARKAYVLLCNCQIHETLISEHRSTSRILEVIVEGLMSIVGTPRSKIGKRVAEGLFVLLMVASFIVGMILYAQMIGW